MSNDKYYGGPEDFPQYCETCHSHKRATAMFNETICKECKYKVRIGTHTHTTSTSHTPHTPPPSRKDMERIIERDIDAICSIYPSIAMYSEPRARLAQRIAHNIHNLITGKEKGSW